MTAILPDYNTLIQAGFNPKTKLPYKFGDVNENGLKEGIKAQLRILDEQNAVNRYTWYNLPNGLTGQMVERMLYYKGQLAFFYLKETNKFYMLPYALCAPKNETGLDVYGRFTGITPVRYCSSGDKEETKAFIKGMIKRPLYEPTFEGDELDFDPLEDGCVLLRDYTQQRAETEIPRQALNDPVLEAMAEAFPFARTSLLANCGVKGMRVNDENGKTEVKTASKSLVRSALNGDPWIPITDPIEFQDLTNGSALKSEEYLLYMQAMDNYRLSLYGLKNGGLFQKKSHMLEAEQDMNSGNVGLVYEDGLTIRQRFCDIVNSIVPLGIWCEANPNVVGMGMLGMAQDMDTDGGEQTQTTDEGGADSE